MEIVFKFVAVSCAVVLVILACKLLNWAWLRPRRLEKFLRKQGLKGSSYRLVFGDIKDMVKAIKEAKSKTINLSDDNLPRAVPFVHQSIKKYGFRLQVHFRLEFELNAISASFILFPVLQQGMLPAFNMSCSEMIAKWEGLVFEKASCELDVWPYLQTLSSDAISRTAFGSSYEEGRLIFELQTEQAELAAQAAQSLYIPGSRFLPTKRNKKMKEISKEVQASIWSIINKRLKSIEAGEGSSDDLLGILMESNLKEIRERGNNNSGMSIMEVIEECKLFYFAGQETTSSLLVWTMVLLSKYPNWQVRAREEVNMIFYEVLRLYPPVVSLNRVIYEETKVGEMCLPAGVLLSLSLMVLQQDTELWGDDAKEFNPERFSEGVSKATKGQVSYFPFGWGPRICIGQNFAMLEAKMALAMILQRFSFTLSPSYAHAPHTVITLQPQYGAHLMLQKL
ncbi:hypothetical protein RJ640_014221 [Escallonia rubra]|uniref:Cytochrome P450 n=1 Tax=Escallonia rubra TaxID=112253 RepID=A0AA88QU75_9ASTE|nr:hypothetical protein RJ640_014221 [Escallonia rubra]